MAALMRGLHRFDPITGAASPLVEPRQPRDRLGLIVAAGGVLLLAWAVWVMGRTLAEPLPTPDAVAPALVIPAEPTTDAIAPLLTALANQPGSAGNPMIVATAEPTPTSTPFPPRPTKTPFPSCPQPGRTCEWPEPAAPVDVKPTPTPLPVCVTPVPGDRCLDAPEDAQVTPRTTDAHCWSAGWRRVCWPPEGG